MGLIPTPVRMLLPLTVVYTLKSVPTDDEETLFLIRAASASVQLSTLALVLYLYRLAILRDDQTGVQLRESEINPNPAQNWFSSGSQADDPIQRWTAVKYDKKQIKQLIQQTVISIVIGFGIHYYWGYVPPIVLSPIMGMLNFIDSPLFALYFLNRTDRDDPDLKRPFKKTGPFANLQEQLAEAQSNAQGAGNDRRGPRRRGGRGGRGRSIESLPSRRGGAGSSSS